MEKRSTPECHQMCLHCLQQNEYTNFIEDCCGTNVFDMVSKILSNLKEFTR